MYILDELRKINSRYCREHILNQPDLVRVNGLVTLLESRRTGNPTPLDGDKIICVNPTDGEVSTNGYLEICENRLSLCVWPSRPFVNEDGGTSAGGGPWENFRSVEHLLQHAEYTGKDKKLFCTWGHLGPCGDGAIDFEVEVYVWRVTDKRFYKSTYEWATA